MDKTDFNFYESKDKLWFILTMTYLVLEYGRPMDIIPAIGFFRLGIILSVLLVLSWLFKKNISQAKSKQSTLLTCFILLLVAWIPFARNNYFAFVQTKAVLLNMIFFISAIIYINSFDRLKIFIRLWIFLMIYLAIRGILGKGIAGSNFLQDENDFSLLMVTMLPFGFIPFLYEQNLIKKYLYLVASLLVTMSIVISFSRGGFIGLVAVLVIMWLFSPKKILSLFIIGFIAFNIYYFSDQKYWGRMATITQTEEDTAKERLDSWKAAWNMFKDNLLGVGGGNFPARFPEYQPETMERGMWGRVAHSVWFTLLSELGIPGVLIYSFLLFYNIKDLAWLRKLRNHSDEDLRYAYYLSLAYVASLTGYFVSGTFISVLYYPHYFYITAMIIATKKIAERQILPLNQSNALSLKS